MDGNHQNVRIDRVATGGEGVGHLADGRVVFVGGALPGETADIELTQSKKRFARGRVVNLLDAAPERIEPDCRHVADGCGGCDWRHVQADAQRTMRLQIVRDVLQRVGRIENPDVRMGPVVNSEGRTTVRAVVVLGRAGYRQRRSHHPVLVDSCAAAHPMVADLLVNGRFGSAEEVTIRVGARTGDQIVLADQPMGIHTLPADVVVTDRESLADGQPASITEIVGGRSWQVSAESFFQSSPEGAEALAHVVGEAVADAPAGPLADLYAGVGLFSGLVAGDRAVTAVEVSKSSIADARVNIAEATIVESRVERWMPTPAAVVVADPARAGLGADAIPVLTGTNASRIVLVSCDPGSLGRDAGLLVDAGYAFQHATTVEMFPNTSHVEVVSVFDQR